MRKLLIGFLALSLVVVFAMPAAATDFDISGTYYIRGWYDDNSKLESDSTASALYQQRLRVKSVFKVVDGLKLTVRLDTLEQTWGSVAPASQDPADSETGVHGGYTNDIASGNVKVEMTRLDFVTKVGLISAGYWDTNAWGCTFGNNTWKVGRIQWTVPIGENFYVVAGLEKDYEGDSKDGRISVFPGDEYSDADNDAYILAGIYKGEQVEAGLLWKYVRLASQRPAGNPFVGDFPPLYCTNAEINVITPYFKATFDPFYVEGQIYWADGTMAFEDYASGTPDVNLEGLSWYLMGKYSFGSAYIGGLAAYAQGDDPNSTDMEGVAVNGGWDWDPCLILWNSDFNYKANGYLGHEGYAMTDGQMRNAFIYQIFGGWNPMEDLVLKASYTIATVGEDQIANPYDSYIMSVDDDYGSEFDITANYKIYDNLDYMVGFGYFWAGDFYKGDPIEESSEVSNTYLLVHKLTLSF
ncbi:MAG: hypothetical protein JRC90_00060 [Deltaproteobacteria bacterium]|nr:hypothetical protein [Deltaproteobacteria bacterium]